jgi:hypothetical protein
VVEKKEIKKIWSLNAAKLVVSLKRLVVLLGLLKGLLLASVKASRHTHERV